MNGISESIFNELELTIDKKIIFNIQTLKKISVNLNNYLKGFNGEDSWNNLLKYFTHDDTTKKIQYKEPSKNFIIFRIDELGNVTNSDGIYADDNEELRDYYIKMKFDCAHRLMRLYKIRSYITFFVKIE